MLNLIFILAILTSFGRDLQLISAVEEPEKEILTNESAKKLIDELAAEAIPLCKASSLAVFEYDTDITPENRRAADEAKKKENELWNKYRKRAANSDQTQVTDDAILRQLKIIYDVGIDALDKNQKEEIFDCIAKWKENWSTTKIPKYSNDPSQQLLSLSEIEAILADPESKADEKLYVCDQWKSQVGRMGKDSFKRFVVLANQAAKANKYQDFGEFMRSIYETEHLIEQIDYAWGQVKPLYEQLHAYVRCKLNKQYGDEVVNLTKPIPCCLLGNIHAQDWSNLYPFTAPYPDVPPPTLKDLKEYTAKEMYRDADEFLKDLGLIPLPDTFYEKSMFVKPKDKNVVCQGQVWDMCDGKNYRISRCSSLTHSDYNYAFELVGMTQYAMQYDRKQPFMFQDPANPALQNSIGGVLKLAANRPDPKWSKETLINYLYSLALDQIAFLPFGLLVDKWRWNVFNGEIKEKDYNAKWWKYIREYQGCVSSVDPAKDSIDALSKYHVALNYGYVRYFMAEILHYQIFKRLCVAAGHEGPLYTCDISLSKTAGKILGDAMSLGSSTSWPDVLNRLTGSDKLDSAPLKEFYSELLEYLKKDNENNKCLVGWN